MGEKEIVFDMEDIKITEEHMEIINTVFTEEDKKELLKKIERAKLLSEFNRDKSELIRRLAENENVSDIEEITGTGYLIKPIAYKYKDKVISIKFESVDKIEISKRISIHDDEKGCILYKYRASSMRETLEVIEEIHNAIDIGII